MRYNTFRFIAASLAVTTLLGLASCQSVTKPPKETTPPEPEISAAEVYSIAAEKLKSSDSLRQLITVSTERTISDETFNEYKTATANYIGLGTDEMMAVTTEKAIYDGNSKTYYATTTYADETVYYEIEGEKDRAYSCETDATDYLETCIPAAFFSCELYEKISFDKKNNNIICFSKATDVEEWADNDRGKIVSAKGSATLSKSGNIVAMSYEVSYEQGPASVKSQYTCRFEEATLKAEDVEIPDEKICLPVPDISVPALLKRAEYNMPLSDYTGGTTYSLLYSQAVQAQSLSTTQYYYVNDFEKGTYAKICDNYSGLSKDQTYSKTEVIEYKDGKVTLTVNGVTEDSYYANTKNDVVSHVFQWQGSILPTLSDINGIEATATEDFLIVSYSLDSSLGADYENDISDYFFDDPDYLDGYATAYNTRGLGGYFAIDLDTLLPTASAVEYMGAHVIDGQTYTIGSQQYFTFSAADKSVFKEITGEALPEKTPEKEATPLLYEVSKDSGEKMYLFGTIHVGDERTSLLPEEFYKAFNESDALAVEFDITSFDEDLSNDEDLMQTMANAVFYTDGSTIADHISPEVYGYAMTLMRVAGINPNILAMRPSVWANTIENFMLTSSRTLDGDYGADNRLLKLASESAKKILEVESAEKQLSMFSRYPDKTQEMMLASVLGTSRGEYIERLTELYELWCRGDEAALREAVNKKTEIPEDATEEEIKAYEEYEKIMLENRDKDMLKVAESYLSSGETVFYAVGLAHLLGDETGLIDALRDAGYTVELVEYK